MTPCLCVNRACLKWWRRLSCAIRAPSGGAGDSFISPACLSVAVLTSSCCACVRGRRWRLLRAARSPVGGGREGLGLEVRLSEQVVTASRFVCGCGGECPALQARLSALVAAIVSMRQVEGIGLRDGFKGSRGRMRFLGTRFFYSVTNKVNLLEFLLILFLSIAHIFAHDLALILTVTAQLRH